MLLGISPVRISFAGGGTDMPEYFERYGGSVITTSINHFTYVIINSRADNYIQIFSTDFQSHNIPVICEKLEPKEGTELPIAVIKYLKYDKGINLMISSDVPLRSGLGSSSSLAVNLINVFSHLQGNKLTKSKIADLSHEVERNYLHWPMGKQDEYISAYGGLNYIKFSKEKIDVCPINISKHSFKELQDNLLLFFIGSRTSSNILPTQIENIQKSNKQTLESLDRVKLLADNMYDSLNKSDLTTFAEYLHNGWLAKKNFSRDVSNDYIDKLYETAIENGALGGKLTGAGGGGHLLLYCEKSKQPKIIEKMSKFGLKKVDFNFENEGAKILNLYDYASKISHD